MNACIRATRAPHAHRTAKHHGQRALQLGLNGSPAIRLHLPPLEARSVVLDRQLQLHHSGVAPRMARSATATAAPAFALDTASAATHNPIVFSCVSSRRTRPT